MRRVLAVGLVIASLLPAPARAQSCDLGEAQSTDLLDEIQGRFPPAKKWFGMVSALSWTGAAGAPLTPQLETLRSRFVLPRDPAGQVLGARLPRSATGPHEVWLDGNEALSVRTEEIGIRAVPAEILRGVVVYRGAVAGGDLLYKITPTHVDEYLYLRDPPAGLYREFEFDVGRDVASLREAGRMIEVIGKDGVAHLRLSAPVARAADGTRRTGTVYVEGRRIVEEIDLRGLPAPILVDPDWTTTGAMAVAHWADFGYLRADRKVMAVGGCALASCPLGLAMSFCNQVLPTVDIWDPDQGIWTFGPSLSTGRYSYAGVVLEGGDLVVAGGCTASECRETTALAERWSNAQNQFVSAGSLPHPLANATASALPGGDALLPGGCDDKSCLASVARYDAARNTWSAVAALSGPRGYATTTTLADGTVLVVGGCADVACATVLGDAERYDPKSNTWRNAGSMSVPRAGHTATLLDDGTVLVTGGCTAKACKGTTLASTEIWRADPNAGGVFARGPDMNAGRHHHTATRLESGELLIAGGTDGTDATRTASEIYMPLSRRFLEAPRMMMSRAYHIAVPLPSGKVLVGGGCNPATCLPWAEVFSPEGLPVEVPDGGVVDAGFAGDMMSGGPADYGAALPVKGGPHPRLYRTGVTSCSNDDVQEQQCPVPGWPAQDGQFQPNQRDLVPESGDVVDRTTGLTWQAKDDGKSYTWADAQAFCVAFSTSSAGAGSWRLPTVVELMTTIDYGKLGPSMDQAFASAQSTNYWTATPMAGSQMLAWTVKFDAGEIVPLLRDTTMPVRCVRGTLKTTQAPAGRLRLAGPYTPTDRTVRDDANSLEWQRRDDGVKRNWREALDYCARLDLDGHDDWHLPNNFELLSIVEWNSDEDVKIDPLFEGTHRDIYWSSTFGEGLPTLSWSVTFNLGVIDGVTITGKGYARCVRHLQPPASISGGGCGCRVGQRDTTPPVALLIVSALVGLVLRRRRR